jgi:uncharacterized protein (DUF885 family)
VALARAYAAAGSANPFAVPPQRLEQLDADTRAAFAEAAAREVTQAIAPAAARLVALLEGPYALAAPDAVGVATYPGGRAYYDWLVQWHTTLPVTPAEVHRIGLAEVARIEREMAAIRAELGFTGTREAFHAQLAKDPRFFAKVPEEFGQRLMTYAERLRPLLPRAFGRFPAADGDVRRLAPELEPAMTFGFYQPPTAADPMGHYFFNGTKLEERSLLTAAPLIAHELWPGHHFQVALARENPALPPYRRSRFYTAFGEGWGDYASIVAGDLGLYPDPYERYGRLAMDMFISCRLVVDTGMNGLGWSLERGRQYMRAHVLESEAQILTESLRYSTDLPGQALAYKMGSREFVRLRAQAERAMGARFALPAFHDGGGARPGGRAGARGAVGEAGAGYGVTGRRMARPGSALRTSAASRITGTPCTTTCRIPTEVWLGAVKVARSVMVVGSNTTRSASIPGWSRPLRRICGTLASRIVAGVSDTRRSASRRSTRFRSRT